MVGYHKDAGIVGRLRLNAGPHVRRFFDHEGDRLALHVGSHQGPVRVVMLQEGNQARGHREYLARRNVHVLDLLRSLVGEVAPVPAGDHGFHEMPLVVQFLVRLGNEVKVFLVRGEVLDLVGQLAVIDIAVRRLQEAVIVDARVGAEGDDEADVRSFRRLDGAHPPVVGRVHVPHLEAGPFPRETAGPQGVQPALVGELRQGIGLVHELRKLA